MAVAVHAIRIPPITRTLIKMASAIAVISSTVAGTSVSNGTAGVTMPGPAAFPAVARNEERCRAYLHGVRNRDSHALDQFYGETSSVVFSLAVRILNDTADAEEVVLDVYEQVWKSAQTFDESRGSILGWLTMLTRSRAIDRLRRSGSRRQRELPIDTTWEMASNDPLPEQQTALQQERALVRQAIEQLSPDQREAIELAFFRGLTHVEVAEALGAPLGTIKTRIRMGIQKLRDLLTPTTPQEGIA
jgi:RNA polymerase sigma-70 factor, ECF subfamily